MSTSQDPKYLALARHFTQQIRSGDLKPGDRLPSFTDMRAQFGATPATVERLYALLERENLIERRHRSGVFVADTQHQSTLKGTLGFVALRFNGSQLHPYNHHLLQGIQQEASTAGTQILLLDSNAIEANRDKVDGLLIYEDFLSKFLPHQESGIPCVSLLKHIDDISSVVANDFEGAKAATRHLLELGHKRIACLMGTAEDDLHDSLGALRLEGCRAALREAGIAPNPKWFRPIRYNPFEDYTGRGYSGMAKWLNEDWKALGCTAILTQNDDVAIGVVNALQETGSSVPGDVSVIGFDGAGVDAHFTPRLTTVEVPLQAIGAQGTRMLLQKIGGDTETQHLILPAPLRVSQSSAKPGELAAHRSKK